MDRQERLRRKEEEIEAKYEAAAKAERKVAKQKVANNAVYLLLASIIVVFICIVAVATGKGWYFSKFSGFGFSSLSMTTSLFSITVDISCAGKNTVEKAICRHIAAVQGEYNLLDVQNRLCVLGPPSCATMRQVYGASIVVFASFSVCGLLQLTAGVLLWSYWFVSPLPSVKRWCFACMGLSGLSVLAGVMLWFVSLPDVSAIPMSWNALVSQLPSGELFKVQAATDFLPFGWCFIVYVLLGIFIMGQLLYAAMHFQARHDEWKAEQEERGEYDSLLDARAGIFAQQYMSPAGAPMTPGTSYPPPGGPAWQGSPPYKEPTAATSLVDEPPGQMQAPTV